MQHKKFFLLFLVILLATAFTHAENPFINCGNSSIIMWYNFSSVIDQCGNNDGTNNGASANIVDFPLYNSSGNSSPSSFDFNSVQTDYITIPDNFGSLFDSNSDYSISIWLLSNVSQDGAYIIAMWDDYDVRLAIDIYAQEKVYFRGTNTGTVTSASPVDFNKWYHIVATYSASDGTKLYINATLQNQSSPTDQPPAKTEIHTIGCKYDSTKCFNGRMDEVRIYDKTLNLTEISNIYSFGRYNGTDNATAGGADTTPPVITINAPVNNSILNTDIDINVTIDETGNCSLNNTNWALYNNTSTFFYFKDLTAVTGNYTIEVNCSDIFNNSATKTVSFVKDTIAPNQNWINPLVSNQTRIFVNQTINLLVNYTDEFNVYAYDIRINAPGLFLQYNETGLTDKFKVFNTSLLVNTTGRYYINSTVWDSHTTKTIPVFKNTAENNSLIFDFTNDKYLINVDIVNITDISIKPPAKINTIKTTDRYLFKFEYEYNSEVAEVIKTYRLQCRQLDLLQHSSYNAHFVCFGVKKWVDFTSPNIKRTIIRTCGTDCYDIELTLKNSDTFIYNSIGTLNENRQIFYFTSSIRPQGFINIFNLGYCPMNTTAQVLMYIFMFVLCFVFFWFCRTYIRIPIVTASAGVPFIAFSISVFACNEFVAIGVHLIGWAIIFNELYSVKKQ